MFKFRDLLTVAALLAGVACGVYRSDILKAARPIAAPVAYYVQAPEREAAMQASIKSLTDEVSGLKASVNDRSNQLLHTQQLLEAQEQMARDSRARFERHLQKLRELGSEADVDMNVAGFIE